MKPAAHKFPHEVETLLRTAQAWDGLTPAAKTLLLGLGVKLEPFVVPLRVAPGQNDLRGFECLAYGDGGLPFGMLQNDARAAGLREGLLSLTLFHVALLTGQALVKRVGSAVPGSLWQQLRFSINVDAALLAEPAFGALLDSLPRPSFPVLLEASENLQVEHARPLRVLLDRHESWLGLALDDSDELAHDTRSLLTPRVRLVKADGRYVRKLYRDRDRAPDFCLARLRELRQPDHPFVAEGVESDDLKRYLQDRWQVSAHGELWMQGYHIQVPDPWSTFLTPLGTDPQQPQGYVVPDDTLAAVGSGQGFGSFTGATSSGPAGGHSAGPHGGGRGTGSGAAGSSGAGPSSTDRNPSAGHGPAPAAAFAPAGDPALGTLTRWLMGLVAGALTLALGALAGVGPWASRTTASVTPPVAAAPTGPVQKIEAKGPCSVAQNGVTVLGSYSVTNNCGDTPAKTDKK